MKWWTVRASILFCTISTNFLWSQLDPLDQLRQLSLPEAPPALFSANLGDASVEFFLQGSWKTFIGGYLFGSDSPNGVSTVSIPGFAQTPWSNSVDFLMSLWIQKHFFFQTQLSDGFQFNTFSLGYANIDGPGLNKVSIGNTGIEIPSFPFLMMGKAGKDVPGIVAEWSTATSKHYAMLRLLSRNTVTQKFSGTSASSTRQSGLNSFIRGRFFQLPYTHLTGISVWVEDSSGTNIDTTGRRYRLLIAQDFQFINPEAGAFGLVQAAQGRILASFSTSPDSQAILFPALDQNNWTAALGSIAYEPNPGSPFETRVVNVLQNTYNFPGSGIAAFFTDIAGTNVLTVYIPGLFSVFEDLSWYPKPQGLQVDSVRIDSGDSASLSAQTLGDSMHLVYQGARDLLSRYPILGTAHPDRNSVYLPSYRAKSEYYLEWLGNAPKQPYITLDQDPLPESIEVIRNGLPETAFLWNSNEKRLDFVVPIQAGESVSVKYDLANRIGGSRTVQFAQGNIWTPDPSTQLELSIGLDWPIEKAISTNTGTDTGRISAGSRLGFSFPQESFSGFLSLGALFSVPDAAGTRMIQDYSGSSLSVAPDPSALVPSAPSNITDLPVAGISGFFGLGVSPSVPGGAFLAAGSRGKLYYHDFTSDNGTYLGWNGSPSRSWDYAFGNPVGPSIAETRGEDPFSGRVVVADIGITSTENWAAFDIILTEDQRSALQQTGTISFFLMGTSFSGDPLNVYIQAGELGEDIDADGTTDSGSSGLRGFSFDDSAHNVTLTASYGYVNRSEKILSEDRNSNLILSPDRKPLSIFLGTIDASSTETWHTINLSLSGSDRIRLQSPNAIRLLLTRRLGDVSGRILLGGLRLDLPSLAGLTGTSSNTNLSTGTDANLSRKNSLAAAFPQAVSSEASAEQSFAKWQTLVSDTFELRQVLDGGSIYDRRYQRFYLQATGISGTVAFRARMEDEYGAISSASISLGGTGNWLQASFDLVEGTFSLSDGSGGIVYQGAAVVTGAPRELKRMIIGIESTGASTGTLFLDSFMSAEGIASFQGRAQGGLKWAHPQPLVSIENFVFLGNIRTDSRVELLSDARLSNFSLLEEPGGLSFLVATSLGATIAYLDFFVSTRVQAGKDGVSGQGAYQIIIPAGISSPITLKDSFSSDIGTAVPFLQKESAISISLPPVFGIEGLVKMNQSDRLLSQNWKAGVRLGSDALGTSVSWDLAQSSPNFLVQSIWNGLRISEKVLQGYTNYIPFSESAIENRISSLLGVGSVQIDAFGLNISAKLGTSLVPGNSFSFSDSLALKSAFTFGQKDSTIQATLVYERLSAVTSNWRGSMYLDELQKGASDFINFAPSWKVFPFVEMFDNGESFFEQSEFGKSYSVRPQATLGIARALDATWVSLIVPKQLSFTLARNLTITGNLHGDNIGIFGSMTWNGLNQFGARGAQPLFSFYETDQLEGTFSAGYLLQGGSPLRWMVAHTTSILLFGLSGNEGHASKWRSLSSASAGLIEIMPPDQLRLSNRFSFLAGDQYRTGDSLALDLSWYVETPDLSFQFLNRQAKSAPFLQNIESLEFSISSLGAVDPNPSTPPLADLFPSVSSGDSATNSAMAAIRHKSYLIFPGLAYITLQVAIGYYRDSQTSLYTVAAQFYAEAKIVF